MHPSEISPLEYVPGLRYINLKIWRFCSISKTVISKFLQILSLSQIYYRCRIVNQDMVCKLFEIFFSISFRSYLAQHVLRKINFGIIKEPFNGLILSNRKRTVKILRQISILSQFNYG